MRTLCFVSLLFVGCGGFPPTHLDGGTGGGTASAGYDLDDVSFLYPLPSWAGRDGLLSMRSSGAQGALLPKALFAQLPALLVDVPADTVYDALRVVSVRVDPCFPGSTPPAEKVCRRQVRLVAQPILNEGADGGFLTNGLTTDDATVHLFYDLNETQFAAVLEGIQELKRAAGDATKGQPLDIHPVMKHEGLDGPYAQALDTLVLKAAGDLTLTRVAFMALQGFGGRWTFGAYNRSGATLVADPIPRTNGLLIQGVVEQGTGSTTRAGELVPSIAGDDLVTLLASFEVAAADEGTLDRALTSALQIEHPDRSSPRTIDCGSCHVASRARTNAERVRSVDTSSWPDAFNDARFNLKRVDGVGDDPRALRSFGYLGKLSALSQRTINESAEIAAALTVSAPY